MRVVLRSIGYACVALTGAFSARAQVQLGASADALLRPAVRIAGVSDTSFTLAERMKFYHVPGVSLAMIDNGRIVFAKGYGVLEVGRATPVDTSTLFLAGSISKPVFATGVMRLVEQGKLTLDTDINATLKSWKLPENRFTATEKVTLRRLLTHTAGLTVWGFPGYDVDSLVPTVPQLLDGTRPSNTPAVRNDTTPGVFWRYSGGGITIAQLMAQDVTSEPFPALMDRLVLKPTEMVHSTYENPLPGARHKEAASGHEQMDTPVHGRFHIYPEMAAAGLWTTAPDLARWALALTRSYLGNEQGILKPATAREMISRQAIVRPPLGNGFWGLGVTVSGEGDSISFSHGGRDEGFVAQVTMYPKLGKGFAILTNGVTGSVIPELTRAIAERYGMPAPPRIERKVVAINTTAESALAGEYDFVTPMKNTISVRWDGQALQLTDTSIGRTMRIYHEGNDVFFDRNTGQRFVFERAPGEPFGRAVSMTLGQGTGRPVGKRR